MSPRPGDSVCFLHDKLLYRDSTLVDFDETLQLGTAVMVLSCLQTTAVGVDKALVVAGRRLGWIWLHGDCMRQRA